MNSDEDIYVSPKCNELFQLLGTYQIPNWLIKSKHLWMDGLDLSCKKKQKEREICWWQFSFLRTCTIYQLASKKQVCLIFSASPNQLMCMHYQIMQNHYFKKIEYIF